MRRQIAVATALVGVALLTTPAFVHSHSSHSGHLGFGLYDESPEDANVTILTDSDFGSSVMEKIRSAAREDDPGSVILHADEVSDSVAQTLTRSERPVYVRIDSNHYRIRRHYDVGGFFDLGMLIQYGGVFVGIVLVILGMLMLRGTRETD